MFVNVGQYLCVWLGLSVSYCMSMYVFECGSVIV